MTTPQELKEHEDSLTNEMPFDTANAIKAEEKYAESKISFVSAILSVAIVFYLLMILFFGTDESYSTVSILSAIFYTILCGMNILHYKHRIKNFIILECCLSIICILQVITDAVYTYARIHSDTSLVIIRAIERFQGVTAATLYTSIYDVYLIISAIIVVIVMSKIKSIDKKSKIGIVALRITSIILMLIAIYLEQALILHYMSSYP